MLVVPFEKINEEAQAKKAQTGHNLPAINHCSFQDVYVP